MARNEDELTPDELETSDGEPLPDREAMSILPVLDPIGLGDQAATLPVEHSGDEHTLPIEPPAEA